MMVIEKLISLYECVTMNLSMLCQGVKWYEENVDDFAKSHQCAL
jgi:hypothetical protein